MASDHAAQLQAFITKWQASGAAERANAHLFISELCGLLDVKPPEPKTPDEHRNAYVFEKTIPAGKAARTSSTSTSAAASFWKRNRVPTP
jgi:hypothetical protein